MIETYVGTFAITDEQKQHYNKHLEKFIEDRKLDLLDRVISNLLVDCDVSVRWSKREHKHDEYTVRCTITKE